MCLQVCCVDHHSILFTVFSSEAGHHPSEDTLPAPTPPTAIKCFVRPIGSGCITPAQAIADDEDNPAENAPVINARLAMGLWEKRGKTCHLRIRQPEKVAHLTAPFQSRESRNAMEINAS